VSPIISLTLDGGLASLAGLVMAVGRPETNREPRRLPRWCRLADGIVCPALSLIHLNGLLRSHSALAHPLQQSCAQRRVYDGAQFILAVGSIFISAAQVISIDVHHA